MQLVPEVVAAPQPVPQAVAAPQPQPVPQAAPAAAAPAIDYNAIGESIANLAIRKFKQDYRFSGPEVRVTDCTGVRLSSLDAEQVFSATRRALRNRNPGSAIFGKQNSKQKFTAAGGGDHGALGGHKGRDFNIKVKRVDKDGRARQDVKAEAQVHVRWL